MGGRTNQQYDLQVENNRYHLQQQHIQALIYRITRDSVFFWAAYASSTGNQQVATMQLMESHRDLAKGLSRAPRAVCQNRATSSATPLQKLVGCEHSVETSPGELHAIHSLQLPAVLEHPPCFPTGSICSGSRAFPPHGTALPVEERTAPTLDGEKALVPLCLLGHSPSHRLVGG